TKNFDIDLFFEEEGFEEPLEFDIKEVSITINDELGIDKFFDISIFKQDQEVINESSSLATLISAEDWSIDDIFFQSKIS
ncbi:23249_t:CDS:1, partial [Racocetra persica]